MKNRKNEKGEIMICCIILIVVISILVAIGLVCAVSAALLHSLGQNEQRDKIVVAKAPVIVNSPEIVQNKDVKDKLSRSEIFTLISALIASAGALAAVAVVPGKVLRVILVIILFSLSVSLFLW